MRQFNKFRGTKGFISLWEQMIRFRYMITEQAKQRGSCKDEETLFGKERRTRWPPKKHGSLCPRRTRISCRYPQGNNVPPAAIHESLDGIQSHKMARILWPE